MQRRSLELELTNTEPIPAMQVKNNKVGSYGICEECGKKWNISVLQRVPKSGYVCPYCRAKQRKRIKVTVKWFLIALTGAILYIFGSEAAYIQRGYRAYGGECLLLLFPLWWYLIGGTIRDIATEITKIYKTDVLENE